MKKVLSLTLLAISLFAVNSFAGGHKCQLDGSCGCEISNKCEQYFEMPNATTIQCGNSSIAFMIPIAQLRNGVHPAEFKGFSLLLESKVQVQGTARKKSIYFATAYCGISIQLEMNRIVRASMNCEGQPSELSCHLR